MTKLDQVTIALQAAPANATAEDLARIAINAMRGPTPAMLGALTALAQCVGWVEEGYDAMINAALASPQPPQPKDAP